MVSFPKLVLAVIITVLFVMFIMVLPTISYFSDVMIYPMQNGVFSYYFIFCFLLTIFTMWVFGRKSYYNAFINYSKYRMLNMDALVTLGSFSAFILTVMLIIVYQIEISDSTKSLIDQTSDRAAKMGYISHMLESTALILTVITIGKYYEGKAKSTIISM